MKNPSSTQSTYLFLLDPFCRQNGEKDKVALCCRPPVLRKDTRSTVRRLLLSNAEGISISLQKRWKGRVKASDVHYMYSTRGCTVVVGLLSAMEEEGKENWEQRGFPLLQFVFSPYSPPSPVQESKPTRKLVSFLLLPPLPPSYSTFPKSWSPILPLSISLSRKCIHSSSSPLDLSSSSSSSSANTSFLFLRIFYSILLRSLCYFASGQSRRFRTAHSPPSLLATFARLF